MIGATLGNRYKITSEIGDGGMATVYRAVDTTLQREVAIKILHPHLAKDADLTQRFQQEAAIAAKLDHANVMKIYDYGTHEDGRCFIVAELLKGENFHKLQVTQARKYAEPFPYYVTLMIVEEVLKGLAHAHAMGVVHRDVKPDNVMVAQDGTVKIMDFGIAKNTSSSLTITGHFLGSPSYASPEQVKGEPVDSRTDLYSTGVILYEALCGRLPFTGQSAPEVMMKICSGKHTPLSLTKPQLPAVVHHLVARCLSLQTSQRPVSAEKLHSEIRSLLDLLGIPSSAQGLQRYFEDAAGFSGGLKTEKVTALSPQLAVAAAAPQVLPTPLPQAQPYKKEEIQRTPLAKNPNALGRGTAVLPPQKNLEGRDREKERERERDREHKGVPRLSQLEISNPRGRQAQHSARKSGGSSFYYTLSALLVVISALFIAFILDAKEKKEKKVSQATPSPTASPRPVARETRRPKEPRPQPIASPLPSETVALTPVSPNETKPTPNPNPRPIQPTLAPVVSPFSTTARPPRRPQVRQQENPNTATIPAPTPPVRLPQTSQTKAPQSAQPASLARLSIQTLPGGALLFLGNQNLGETPKDGSPRTFEVSPGGYVLRIPRMRVGNVRYDGFSRRVFLEAGQTQALGVITLTPIRSLSVNISGPGVIVRINGDPYVLRGKPVVLNLPEGRVDIEARASNGRSLKRTLDLRGEDFSMNASLE
jgi:serine/threonine protein kinase